MGTPNTSYYKILEVTLVVHYNCPDTAAIKTIADEIKTLQDKYPNDKVKLIKMEMK